MSVGRTTEYSLDELRQIRGDTDWERIDAMSDEELERSIADDPDEDIDEWVSEPREIYPEEREQVTLWIDEEVLAYFKQNGRDYKAHINEVLKAYVQYKKAQEANGAH